MTILSNKHRRDYQPLVSICIPAYNAEKTIGSTLQSILNQTYQNLEIIIADNASTDNTPYILEQFSDPRIKIYRNTTTIIAEKNFSRCIELATGDYIAIFHADDLYTPDMVQKQVQAFQDNPSIGAVFTMANRINDHDEVIGEYKLHAELKHKKCFDFYEILNSILRNENFLICPSAIVRADIYKQLSTFNVEKFGTSSDLDMWLRILKTHPISILNEKLMNYRVSNNQGWFLYNYLRTDEADFFKVMDFHLANINHDVEGIPNDSLNIYEIKRYKDNLIRAMNCIYKGQSCNIEKLLKNPLSAKLFITAIWHIEKPKLLAILTLGLMLLVLTYLRLNKYVAKVFHWMWYK